MAEIYNSNGRYVGYLNSRGEVIDTRRGGLGGATATAGARMASRNAAESIRIAAERRAR